MSSKRNYAVPISKELFVVHCVKSVSIWSYSGPHFPTFGENSVRMRENADQNTDTFYTVVTFQILVVEIYDTNTHIKKVTTC